MYYFTSDYTEGCHPLILEKLIATNMEQTGGYGLDYHETRRSNLSQRQTVRPAI